MTENRAAFAENNDVLDAQRFQDVRAAANSNDTAQLHALLDGLHPADIADLLEQISDGERSRLMGLWKGGIDGDVLSELADSIREDIIDGLDASELADAVRDLDSGDVVDLVEDLDEPQQEAILDALEDADRVVVEQSLSFPESSAGRLMQREVVMAPDHWDVGRAIDFLRKSEKLPEQFYHMMLVDVRQHPTGYVTLGKLLGTKRDVPLQDIAEDSFRTIPPSQQISPNATWPMRLINTT